MTFFFRKDERICVLSTFYSRQPPKKDTNVVQTSKNFARWYAAQPSWPIQLVVSEHSPTDYWRLCYEDDPIVTGSDPPSPLTRLVHSRKLPGVLPFGKCRGTLLSINPLPNCFPLPEEIDAIPNEWGNAPECTKAVSYAEGYPSEGQTRLRSTIRSDDDDTLCRFSSLGWVYAEESGVQGKKEWKRTGHVLVMGKLFLDVSSPMMGVIWTDTTNRHGSGPSPVDHTSP